MSAVRRVLMALPLLALSPVARVTAEESTMAAATPPGDGRVVELEARLASLETRMGHGTGALRAGPTLRLDGGEESVLERLRRLERETADAKATVAARERELSDLRRTAATHEARAQELAERVDALAGLQDSLDTARQELADRQQRLRRLDDQLGASETLRLRAERTVFALTAALMRLEPGDAKGLAELQQQARQQAQELRGADGPRAVRGVVPAAPASGAAP